jgi:hypothetical protein
MVLIISPTKYNFVSVVIDAMVNARSNLTFLMTSIDGKRRKISSPFDENFWFDCWKKQQCV